MARRVMVRYRVKPDQVERNEELVRAVYAELHEAAPAGFSYATFKLEDGVSFVHIAVDLAADRPSPLSELRAFREFTAGARERCDEPPVTTAATEVGSYAAFNPR
jgi:hypothetical protein